MSFERRESSPSLAEQEHYWKKQLNGELPPLRIPLDHPRPPVPSFFRAGKSIKLGEELYKKLKELCLRENVTLFVTLLAGFNTILLRYTGQEDIIVGTLSPDSMQQRAGEKNEKFTNPLALRTNLTGDPTARELLRRIDRTVRDAAAHRDYPFEKLIEGMGQNQDLNRAPIFQVTLVLRNIPFCISETPISVDDLAEVREHTARCDLVVLAAEEGQGLSLTVDYNAELFEASTIERMLGHFGVLLEGLVVNLEERISRLPLLTEVEEHQVLVAWNDTKADYPREVPFHRLFERQVERTSDAIALAFEDETLTYCELNRRANQVAHYLQRFGVGPEVLVGICIERSIEMVIGLMGIFKAGGAYVPLDPTYPAERLAFMLQETQLPVLLTQQRLIKVLPKHGAHVVCLDTDWDIIAQESAAEPDDKVKSDNLAYVIYTSGSTGQPKGVMIPHRGLVNYLTWASRAYRITGGRGTPVHSSLSFDLTITSLFLPLLVGQTVMLLAEDDTGEILSDTLRQTGDFSLVKLTPAHLDQLSQLLPPDEAAGRTCQFIIGGDALRGENLTFWQTYAPDTRLVNEYGPTETVVGCCIYKVPLEHPALEAVPIGRPIANTQLYVLDRHLQPVPIGIPGELYIGGDGLARGYLNRPDLTAERFVPNPFSPSNQEGGTSSANRLYKTGDLARYLPNGNLEFLGRLDHQVKIRGFRVELGEIEMLLKQHLAVREVIVIAQGDDWSDKRLVAYLVPSHQGSESHLQDVQGELQLFLKTKLPNYMLPSAYVFMETLPLTANGKIDRQALSTANLVSPIQVEDYVPPRNLTEEMLAEIWANVLGVERVSVHHNFFALGGHSLLAMRIISQLRNTWQIEISLQSFFETPTIAGLAQHIETVRWATQTTRITAAGPREEGAL